MHVKWEYLVEGLPIYGGYGQTIGITKSNANTPQSHVQNHLNLRGEEGWEFVQFAAGSGQAGYDVYSPNIIFIFKRLKL